MGCNISSNGHFEAARFDQLWPNEEQSAKEENSKMEHTGWKILRINLISTFKDFRNERTEIHKLIGKLQQKVIKDRIILQLEDFNSGSKASYEDTESIYLLAHCIQQSKKECGEPIYIHLQGECAGYILPTSFSDTNFLASNNLKSGLSLNESAVIMAGTKNSNALYLRRDDSFLEEVPFNILSFVDDDIGRERAVYFAEKIEKHVPPSQVHSYSCSTIGMNDPHHKQIVLTNLEPMLEIVKNHLTYCCSKFSFVDESTMQSSKYLQHEHLQEAYEQLGKELGNLLVKSPNITTVLTLRKTRTFKGFHPKVVKIPQMSEEDAVIKIAQYAEGCGTITPNTSPSTETVAKSKRIYEKASGLDKVTNENLENGKKELGWCRMKCAIIGSLLRFGASEDKIAPLASFSTLSVCEAELTLFEKESRGHLLMACLSFLTIVHSGLTEMELRIFLAPEDKIMPHTISKKLYNTPYDFSLDKYGTKTEISALRWRYTVMRLEHYFYSKDENINHFVLSEVCQRAVWKKYLSKKENVDHFKRRMEKTLSRNSVPWNTLERNAEIRSFL